LPKFKKLNHTNCPVKKRNNETIRIWRIFGWVMLSFLVACQPTKRVPEGKYLLDKVKINTDNKNIERDDLYPYVRQKPNKRIFGGRFHLAVYNLANPEKENKFSQWLQRIGEAPVIYDPVLVDGAKTQLRLYLNNNGYFNANVQDSVVKNKKQATVFYQIKTGNPYFINKVNYQFIDTTVKHLVIKDTVNSEIETGEIFNLNTLNDERLRIENNLANHGYFNFTRQSVYFKADTTFRNNKVNLDMVIDDASPNNDTITPHKKYYLNEIFIHSDYSRQSFLNNKEKYKSELDTIVSDSAINVIYQNKISLKPSAVLRYNYLYPGHLYRKENLNKTYRFYSSLPIIQTTNIRFTELKADTIPHGLLNTDIYLTHQKKQSFSIDGELTFSEGDLGGGGSFNYRNKNLLGGAETFNLKFFGRIESIRQRKISPSQDVLQEYGAEANIQFPTFLLPWQTSGFEKRFNPKTEVSVGYNFQNPGFMTRNITNVSFGYNWKGNSYNRHIVKPFDLYYVNLIDTSQGFNQVIKNVNDPSSFTTHLVSATSYSFVFSNQQLNSLKDFVYLRYNIETAGNLLSLYYNTLERSDTTAQRQFLNNIYAQYIKSDIDFRYYQQINEGNTLVYRLFMGAGLPYGNSRSLPSEKQYFAGGSTNRAYSPYRLAPDSATLASSGSIYRGDIKLEANIEYRFDLPWLLEGALFTDAGNVWNLKSIDVDNEAANPDFKIDRFYQQLGVSTGIGLRFDLSFFIFRVDYAIRLIDPLISNKVELAPFNQDVAFGDITKFDIGIGYPF